MPFFTPEVLAQLKIQQKISSDSLDDERMEEIAKTLEENEVLTELNLQESVLTDSGIERLITALKNIQTLEELTINPRFITSKSVAFLETLVEEHYHLIKCKGVSSLKIQFFLARNQALRSFRDLLRDGAENISEFLTQNEDGKRKLDNCQNIMRHYQEHFLKQDNTPWLKNLFSEAENSLVGMQLWIQQKPKAADYLDSTFNNELIKNLVNSLEVHCATNQGIDSESNDSYSDSDSVPNFVSPNRTGSDVFSFFSEDDSYTMSRGSTPPVPEEVCKLR